MLKNFFSPPTQQKRELLASKLAELNARKERVDQLTEFFRTLEQAQEEEEGRSAGHGEVMEPSANGGPASAGGSKVAVAESAQATGGTDELVVDEMKDAENGMEDMHQKRLREATEVRRKLKEIQRFLTLQEVSSDLGKICQ